MGITSDRSVNIVILVVSLLIAGNAALQLAERFGIPVPVQRAPASTVARAPAAIPTTPAAPEPYQPGDTVPALNDYSYDSANGTLLLVVRSTCIYCTQSMPFYRRLAEKVRQRGGAIKLFAISTEPETTVSEYFKAHDVQINSVLRIPSDYLRVRGTPTLLLVDSAGRIKNSWVGLQQKEQEDAILTTIDKIS